MSENIILTKQDLELLVRDVAKVAVKETLESFKVVKRRIARDLLQCSDYKFNQYIERGLLTKTPENLFLMSEVLKLRENIYLDKLK